MNGKLKLSKFAKYAWFALAYNLVVILWGAFLRASLSGDGCGQFWLTCGGEVVPSAPMFKTIIEFSHRVSTGLSFFVVLFLSVWAFRQFASGSRVRRAAFASFILIIFEALIGAGLVLTGNTANNWTPTRPFWMAAHLITTFSLLAALTLTAWFAQNKKSINFRAPRKVLVLMAIGVAGILLIGMSGSIAALSSMLFPATSLAEGIARDFSSTSHIILRLRVSHPILSVIVGIFLIFLAGWLKARAGESRTADRWANVLSLLVLVQFASGALTLWLHAPILMQIIHLLLADLVWIAFVLLSANVLSELVSVKQNTEVSTARTISR